MESCSRRWRSSNSERNQPTPPLQQTVSCKISKQGTFHLHGNKRALGFSCHKAIYGDSIREKRETNPSSVVVPSSRIVSCSVVEAWQSDPYSWNQYWSVGARKAGHCLSRGDWESWWVGPTDGGGDDVAIRVRTIFHVSWEWNLGSWSRMPTDIQSRNLNKTKRYPPHQWIPCFATIGPSRPPLKYGWSPAPDRRTAIQ